ncbi:fibro-slime domain-containing protein [Pikeienuella piscinae]|uniref:Fibro-slime domain-containing protein n=1 Tax=Pikeienuella piscinae TaxID=2748098 RepID=A0A7M3T5T3_9RHOB|nr:fibro-slime domain-containing protein [Pikeienuella piscinae]QIE57364.1 fibro-slime domain-containing protein [Pikeienuella piscinae]
MRSVFLFPVTVTAGLVLSAGVASALTLGGTVRDFDNTHPNFGQGTPFGLLADGQVVSSALTGAAPSPIFVEGDRTNPPVNFTTHDDYNEWWTGGVASPYDVVFSESGGVQSFDGAASTPGSQFFPAGSNNYLFTLQFGGLLSFEDGDTFSASSDDDLWIFVDNKLVLELAGVHSPASDSFSAADLMLLGLVSGQNYAFDVFYAERNVTQAQLNLSTDMTISAVPLPAALPLFLGGLAFLGFVSRRRATA